MSVKAPPLTEIKSCAPSNPTAANPVCSREKSMENEICGLTPFRVTTGEVRKLLALSLKSVEKAKLGAEGGGAPKPLVFVCQSGGVPGRVLSKLAVQPAGRLGATTPSKFSEKMTLGLMRCSSPSTRRLRVRGCRGALACGRCLRNVLVSQAREEARDIVDSPEVRWSTTEMGEVIIRVAGKMLRLIRDWPSTTGGTRPAQQDGRCQAVFQLFQGETAAEPARANARARPQRHGGASEGGQLKPRLVKRSFPDGRPLGLRLRLQRLRLIPWRRG